MLLLMVQESGEHQLRLVVYPSDYKGNFWFPSTSKLFENQDRSSTQILFKISLQIPHTKKKDTPNSMMQTCIHVGYNIYT